MFAAMIVDNHPLFRAALCQVITSMYAPQWIYEASTLEEARQFVASGSAVAAEDGTNFHLGVILLDLCTPGSVGFSGLVELRDAAPDVPIVVVSAATSPAIMRNSIIYGAAGFIPKSFSRDQIGDALRQVLSGEVFLPNDAIVASLSGLGPPGKLHDRVATLTPCQMKVFELLAKGKSNKIIASELNIKVSTVKAHITAIFRKLHVFSRTQAVIAARELDES